VENWLKRCAATWTAAAVLAACSSGSAAQTPGARPARAQNMAPYEAAKLVMRWNIIAMLKFEEGRANRTPAVDAMLDEFLSLGAVRAVKERAREPRLKAADAAIERFARAVLRAAVRRDDGSLQLTDASFYAGMKAICPAYPFC